MRVAVRVQLGDSDAPVAGAELSWLAFGASYPSADPVMRLRYLQDRGERAVTGADGRAMIRYGGNRLRVYATAAGSLFGTESYAVGLLRSSTAGDVVLRVYPEVEARFLVVDPVGRAVPRAGIAFYAEGRFAELRLRTDQAGQISVPLRAYGLRGGEVRVQAVAWGGGGPVRRVAVDSLAAGEPTVLRLPASGEIHVRARARDALDVGERLESLRPRLLAQDDTDRDGVRVYPPADGPRESYDESGVARFGPVLTDTSYRVQAGFGGLERKAQGPARPGEVVIVDLAFDRAVDRFLTVRLRLRDGLPVSTQQVDLRLRNERGRSIQSWYRSRTDAAGLVVVRRNAKEGEPHDLRVTATIAGVPHVGVLPAKDLQSVGRTDLGDLMLVPLPLLVAGSVVDTAGRPVLPRIGLEAQCRLPKTGEAEPFNLFGGGSSKWRDMDGKLRWLEGGAFELYSEESCDRKARLMAKQPLVALQEGAVGVPFAVGQRDVRVVVETGGQAEFEFMVDDERLVDILSIQLCRAADGETEPGGVPGAARRRGGEPTRFRASWQGLAPGRYVVQVFGSEYDALFAAPPIEIGRGGAVSGLSNEVVDLRGRVRYVALAVEGADGAAVGRAQVRSRCSGTETPWVLESAGLAGLATSSALDLRIDAGGYESLFLTGVRDDLKAFAQPLVPVRFQADGWPVTATAGASIRLQIKAAYPSTPVRAFHFRTFHVRTSLSPRGDSSGFQVEASLPQSGSSQPVLLPASALPWRVVPADLKTGGITLAPFDVRVVPRDRVVRVCL